MESTILKQKIDLEKSYNGIMNIYFGKKPVLALINTGNPKGKNGRTKEKIVEPKQFTGKGENREIYHSKQFSEWDQRDS